MLIALRGGARDGQIMDMEPDSDGGVFFEASPAERYHPGTPVVTRDTERGAATVMTFVGPAASSLPSPGERTRAT